MLSRAGNFLLAWQLIDERIEARATEELEDLALANPFVDQALADVERGDVISRDDHEARIEAVRDPPQVLMGDIASLPDSELTSLRLFPE